MAHPEPSPAATAASPATGTTGDVVDVPARRGPALVRAAVSEYAVLLLAILYFLAVWPFLPELASGGNLANVFSNMLPLLAVALGQTIVMITGGIDLSATAVIALASVAGAAVMNEHNGLLAGHPAAVPAAVVLMLLVGCAVGLLNGAAITAAGMPPFIVTLAMMTTAGGVAVWATRSRNIPLLPEPFLLIGQGVVGGAVPVPLLLVGPVAALAHVVLSRTVAGRWVYAIGLNARAARVSGVPVRRVTAAAYVASGACAAVASILYTARLETGSPTLGREILLDVIGATVIGGTSLFGGRGKVLWTVFGVLLFTLISNSLNLFGLSDEKVMIVKGCVILVAAALDWVRNRVLA